MKKNIVRFALVAAAAVALNTSCLDVSGMEEEDDPCATIPEEGSCSENVLSVCYFDHHHTDTDKKVLQEIDCGHDSVCGFDHEYGINRCIYTGSNGTSSSSGTGGSTSSSGTSSSSSTSGTGGSGGSTASSSGTGGSTSSSSSTSTSSGTGGNTSSSSSSTSSSSTSTSSSSTSSTSSSGTSSGNKYRIDYYPSGEVTGLVKMEFWSSNHAWTEIGCLQDQYVGNFVCWLPPGDPGKQLQASATVTLFSGGNGSSCHAPVYDCGYEIRGNMYLVTHDPGNGSNGVDLGHVELGVAWNGATDRCNSCSASLDVDFACYPNSNNTVCAP